MLQALKTVIFGKQGQATKKITAVVDYLSTYMRMAGYAADDSRESVIQSIKDTTVGLAGKEQLSLEDDMFLKLVFGRHTTMYQNPVILTVDKVNGKINFMLTNQGNVASTVAPAAPTHRVEIKATRPDNMAEELIKQILSACPNRGDYPEDDALAAILYGEIYWKERVV